ncbi:MAG: hypothetical protein IKN41_05050 [Candidatus Methanomethylophilaceae archaeon]|nr:hypothetical protein [Candidatus Methanomethylophilaceae archaeon]
MTNYDYEQDYSVHGKLQATDQATAQGDAVILNSDAQVPGTLLPQIYTEITIPANGWTGNEAPYTNVVAVNNVSAIYLPMFGANSPTAAQREIFAESMIGVSSISGNNVTFTCDADTPPESDLPAIMYGFKGTASGKWTCSFPGGAGTAAPVALLQVTVSSTDSSSVEGITITATPTTITSRVTVVTGTTGADGTCVLSLVDGQTYTVVASKANFTLTPASRSITVTAGLNTTTFTSVAFPTISIDAGSTAAGCAYAIGSYTGVLDSNGEVTISVPAGTYSVNITPPAGYFDTAAQSITASDGNAYTATFTLSAKPVLTVSITSASSGGKSGRTVSATNGTDTKTAQTNSSGVATLTLDGTGTYTVSVVAVAGYLTPDAVTVSATAGSTPSASFTVYACPVINIAVTDSSNTGGNASRVVTYAVNGGTNQTITTDASGAAQIVLNTTGTVTFSLDAKTGYVTTASASAISAAGDGTYTASFTVTNAPVIRVTVADSGLHSSIGVSVTGGGETKTGTVDASSGSGYVDIPVSYDNTVYTVSIPSPPSGGSVGTTTVTSVAGSTTSASTLTITYGWKFSMTFDADTFKTNPTSCLAYADDCSGYTPVSGPGSSLAKCSTIGSWVMNADGTSDNPMLDDMFYATFTSGGVLHEKLNPQDLSKKIATWNNSTKQWESASGSSSIASENTMLCIPTIYISTGSNKFTISSIASNGTADAHIIGGHTYQYLALGVYEGYDDGSKLWSLSGKVSSGSITRPNFRTHAHAQTVQNGHAMIWNFHMWKLWRLMVLFACKSFNGQTQIGQGGFTYNGNANQGLCNAMGPFAGSSSASASTSTSVKAFLENPWGYKYEFIDDFVHEYNNSTHKVWIGQNVSPTDTPASSGGTCSDKTAYTWGLSASDFPLSIHTDTAIWGLGGSTGGGSNATGLCDKQYTGTSGPYLGIVGGYSGYVSNGSAGPGCLSAGSALSGSGTRNGARLAFVFDL